MLDSPEPTNSHPAFCKAALKAGIGSAAFGAVLCSDIPEIPHPYDKVLLVAAGVYAAVKSADAAWSLTRPDIVDDNQL